MPLISRIISYSLHAYCRRNFTRRTWRSCWRRTCCHESRVPIGSFERGVAGRCSRSRRRRSRATASWVTPSSCWSPVSPTPTRNSPSRSRPPSPFKCSSPIRNRVRFGFYSLAFLLWYIWMWPITFTRNFCTFLWSIVANFNARINESKSFIDQVSLSTDASSMRNATFCTIWPYSKTIIPRVRSSETNEISSKESLMLYLP